MNDRQISAAGRAKLAVLLGEHAPDFLAAAEVGAGLYVALSQIDDGHRPKADAARYASIVQHAKRLRRDIVALSGVQWHCLSDGWNGRLSDRQHEEKRAQALRLLEGLIREADFMEQDARQHENEGRAPSPGEYFIQHLVVHWTHPGKVSATKKSTFFRAVCAVCEHSQIGPRDPSRWITAVLELQAQEKSERLQGRQSGNSRR